MCFAEPTPNVLPRELLPIFVLPRATPGLSVFKFGLELEPSSLGPNVYLGPFNFEPKLVLVSFGQHWNFQLNKNLNYEIVDSEVQL